MNNLIKKVLSVIITGLIAISLYLFGGTTFTEEEYVEYHFQDNEHLKDHYKKHGKDMGFENKQEYEKAASEVINNPDALHKIESEDGDDVYYLVETNEIVFVSSDGYIRTYFYPERGKDYFDKQ